MFANRHIENEMLPSKRGPYTLLMPEGKESTIFDAGMAYVRRGTPTIIVAGGRYGSGSSRDWAAKGLRYLGVCAVLAESFERIHRANLVSVGILPVTFMGGSNRKTLRLNGHELFRLSGIKENLAVGGSLKLHITWEGGSSDAVDVILSVENAKEIDTLRSGGLLQVLLHELVGTESIRVN